MTWEEPSGVEPTLIAPIMRLSQRHRDLPERTLSRVWAASWRAVRAQERHDVAMSELFDP